MKPGFISDLFDFIQDGFLTPTLNQAALVLGNRAKTAPTEATPHDIDGEPNHFVSGYSCIAVRWMRYSLKRQFKYPIDLGRGQRQRRRIQPNPSGTVGLDQLARSLGWSRGAGFLRLERTTLNRSPPAQSLVTG